MSNADQIEYWNGDAGKRWAQQDSTMERLLQPVTEALLLHAGVEGCSSALDVGCGGGSQSMMLARRLGAGAKVLGVDISEPMLQVARSKIGDVSADWAQLDFLQADAATEVFPRDSFDLLFSRFGVMFFGDPVAAFSNLRSAMRSGGQLAFCCWQALKNNDWTWIPLQAALRHLPPPAPPVPNAPGPFAFADPERVRAILGESGFADIAVTPHSRTMRFSEAPTLRESVQELAKVGPIGSLLTDQDGPVLEKVLGAMEEVLNPYYRDGALHLPAAIWMVTARAT